MLQQESPSQVSSRKKLSNEEQGDAGRENNSLKIYLLLIIIDMTNIYEEFEYLFIFCPILIGNVPKHG